MTVYAICSQCKVPLRLTPKLALEIARMAGPPVSICCVADMTIEERDE